MGNDPVSNVDPDGGWWGDSFIQDFALKHFGPALVGAGVGVITTPGNLGDKVKGAGWGFGIGLAGSYAATEVPWGDVGNWMGNQFDWRWHELTKEILGRAIMELSNNKPFGGLEYSAGHSFENAWHDFAKSVGILGYTPNKKPLPTSVPGRQNVVPDGISNAKVITLSSEKPKIEIIPSVSWYEVKQKSGTIYPSSYNNQPKGLIDALHAFNPQSASRGWSSLTFVTTSDATLSPAFQKISSMSNIGIKQFRAFYKKSGKKYKVTFVDPSQVDDWQIKNFSPNRTSVQLKYP